MDLVFYLVLSWPTMGTPTLRSYNSAQAACASYTAAKNDVGIKYALPKVYSARVRYKYCFAVSDPEWIQCLVENGDGLDLQEGSCQPKQEFNFSTEEKK